MRTTFPRTDRNPRLSRTKPGQLSERRNADAKESIEASVEFAEMSEDRRGVRLAPNFELSGSAAYVALCRNRKGVGREANEVLLRTSREGLQLT